jgi:regulator of sigma E protease
MQKGAFIRLEPVSLMTFEHLAGDSLKQWKEQASLIVEESAKERVLKRIEEKSREKVLGVRLVDQVVLFNPSVSSMMVGALKQIGSALNALLTGQLSIKWMAGPVGMVTIVTQGFSVGLKQAFYWLAMISLNLGLFNLLPLPMFDGGRIVIELVETLTGRRIPAAVMEFLTYALFIGLIALFLVATYWDISRLATLWQG